MRLRARKKYALSEKENGILLLGCVVSCQSVVLSGSCFCQSVCCVWLAEVLEPNPGAILKPKPSLKPEAKLSLTPFPTLRPQLHPKPDLSPKPYANTLTQTRTLIRSSDTHPTLTQKNPWIEIFSSINLVAREGTTQGNVGKPPSEAPNNFSH